METSGKSHSSATTKSRPSVLVGGLVKVTLKDVRSVSEFKCTNQNGTLVKFKVGDRISWEDPLGLGGVTMYASIVGYHEFGLPSYQVDVVGLNIDPSDTLREASDKARRNGFFSGTTLGYIKTGIDGYGGPYAVTGYAFVDAVRYGKLVLLSTAVVATVNDFTCPTCRNDRCSRSEKSCWKCGGAL